MKTATRAFFRKPENELWLSPVALETRKVELPHRDPADTFLVATARVFDLTLVTADERLLASRAAPMLPNR